jgi:hypothetical protein
MPVSVVTELELVIVNVSDVLLPTGMVAAPNALVIVGGATTTTVSVAVLLVAPVPPSVEEIVPVVLSFAPTEVPVTLTTRVQDALAASVIPDRLTVPEPATAETVATQVPA